MNFPFIKNGESSPDLIGISIFRSEINPFIQFYISQREDNKKRYPIDTVSSIILSFNPRYALNIFQIDFKYI
ncbi:hypothetical protein DC081_01495 [Ignatzschineria cameli]|uniref:Uncharacterized protein n=1 Tax=Ignatzschineria cameli TaxID=2182793 RepID=A0A2U2ARX3_9GAMM|nr:hypothetical protein DC080_03505 [Ignatzschineria cameli]PWD86939.1 hypothetical protein DC077_03755 [Ignatzschineria cameli]PWD91911.1 hypothetical protein DC079_00690 [Ignatzschineria cameli]PWD93502.1 hypothetical protein DC081_01495 [Ignatzschineria cameli]PWD94244.1 hypothetical protein DC078_01495 [Ignatzschineria cameli]